MLRNKVKVKSPLLAFCWSAANHDSTNDQEITWFFYFLLMLKWCVSKIFPTIPLFKAYFVWQEKLKGGYFKIIRIKNNDIVY
jgi:hypothetical protein